MSKVQIVISGEYSDWNIESVFIDDMESAEAFRLLNSTDDNVWYIKEYDTANCKILNNGIRSFWVVLRRDSDGYLRTEYDDPFSKWSVYSPSMLNKVYSSPQTLWSKTFVEADTKEQALKKASDLFAEYMAQKEEIS